MLQGKERGKHDSPIVYLRFLKHPKGGKQGRERVDPCGHMLGFTGCPGRLVLAPRWLIENKYWQMLGLAGFFHYWGSVHKKQEELSHDQHVSKHFQTCKLAKKQETYVAEKNN